MTLRGRFTLAFAAATLVPIVAAAIVAWLQISSGYRAELDRTLAAAHADARRELERLRTEVTTIADVLASGPLLRGLLVDLAKGTDLTPMQRRELAKSGLDAMRALRIDLLTVVDETGTVLLAPHFAGHVDELDAEPGRVQTARVPIVAWAKVLREGKLTRVLVVQAARSLTDRGHQLAALCGRELSAELLAPLRRSGVEARLTDARGDELLATPGWHELGGAVNVDLVLDDLDGRAIAHLVVAVSDAALRQRLRDVALTTLGLAFAAVIAAALLGAVVSRRMTRDLDALLAGVQAVARGELDHRVTARGRDEVGKVTRAFNAMTDDLRQAKERLRHAERVAAWQEIARSLAHEIKNPLTPIQMSVETMRKTWSSKHASFDEIFDESTRTVLEEVQRLKKIVNEFSQFARMPDPERRPLDLNDVVASALALYHGAVKVVRELEPGLAQCPADRDQLTQVVLNLLENARDAVASRGSDQSIGRITVRTRAGRGTVVLEVEDNGPGFDPELSERLFQPYFTTKESGTGLGLAIVRRIVADHGGRIDAQSNPGRGARFMIELPTAPAAASS